MKRESSYLLAAAIASVLLPGSVLGQGLEEIVVTAQRREQSLQDVPISVTAITGAAIEEGGFSDVEDMAAFVPNLFMRDTFTGQSIIVRGIGTATGNEAFEQAVASFADGVYYGRDNLGQGAVFDLERIEVVRGPQPTFAGQSATAGAINIITRKPGETWEGNATAAYGSDEELSFDAAVGGPVSETFGVRFAGRYYALDDAGYTSIIGNVPQGVKKNKAARFTALWQPTEALDFTFKYEYQDVWQRGSAGEYTVCETRPQFSRANANISPGLPAPCAFDTVVNGSNLNVLDGKRGTGGSQDIRATVDALNAASGAAPGSAGYWGYNTTVGPNGIGNGTAACPQTGAAFPGNNIGIQCIAYGLNRVAEYNFQEDRDFKADIFAGNFNWELGNLTLSGITSFVQYDKEDWLDPDDSSFAIFNDHRQESFKQRAQEIRLTSPTDQRFSWMIGAYYQEHDLDSRIDVYTPRVLLPSSLIHPGQNPRAMAFGGELNEDSEWLSGFFATTWNVSDAFRVNLGGRYQDAKKDGRLPAEVAYLPVNSDVYTQFFPFLDNRAVAGTVEASDFLPEVGLEWDATEGVMTYVKYAEAFKNGGFVMSPPVGGGLPAAFTFKPENAEGFEAGIKTRLFDDRMELNVAAYYTEYTNLQVTVFISNIGQFITTNAAEAHTQGLEFDGRWAVTDAFTLGFSGALAAEAEYDAYDGASCNSLEAKQVAPPCRADRAGVALPYNPGWTLSLNPDYSLPLGSEYQLRLGANVRFSDGYWINDNEDPRNEVGSFERVDARVAFSPVDGNWEFALYGRDLTDNRVTVGAQPDFMQKTSDPALYDGFGNTRERGLRYGAQVTLRFGT